MNHDPKAPRADPKGTLPAADATPANPKLPVATPAAEGDRVLPAASGDLALHRLRSTWTRRTKA